jgi:small subunit ribosomal protein S11
MAENEEKTTGSAGEAAESPKGDRAAAGGGGPGGAGEAAPVAGAEGTAAVRRPKARSAKAVPVGIAHIKATFNNTQVAITDVRGSMVAWSSAGRAGFKGSRKSTAFAATMVGQDAAKQAVGRGMHEVEVRVQGAGAGREPAIRALQAAGLSITMIKDITPIPHNGCRARKRRRV